MKRFLLTILFVLFSAKLWAVETPLKEGEPIYWIFGNQAAQSKLQIAFKYRLFYGKWAGLNLEYVQKSAWDIYKPSSPFRDTNYQPSLYYSFPEFYNIVFSGGIIHRSNGRDKEDNRSLDRTFTKVSWHLGEKTQVGLEAVNYYKIGVAAQNNDIYNYGHSMEFKVSFKLNAKGSWSDKEEFYIKASPGGGYYKWEPKKGWLEAGAKIRFFSEYFQLYTFVQVWRGYGEFMLDYNKLDTIVRAGVIL